MAAKSSLVILFALVIHTAPTVLGSHLTTTDLENLLSVYKRLLAIKIEASSFVSGVCVKFVCLCR